MVDVVRVGTEEDAGMVVVAVVAPGGVVLPPDGGVVMEDIMLLKLPLCETGQVYVVTYSTSKGFWRTSTSNMYYTVGQPHANYVWWFMF